jgi:non-ribosomal peptide synthetase component F
MLSHSAVDNLASGLADGPYLPQSDAPLRVWFDGSPVETRYFRQLAALLSGHTLYREVCSPDATEGTGFAQLAAGVVDVLHVAGPVAGAMTAEGVKVGDLRGRGARPAVLLIDAATPELPATVQALRDSGACRLYAVYGPAEACFGATIQQLAPQAAVTRMVGAMACIAVDGMGQPLPVGVVGELMLVGKGLARGYYGAPELSEDRFSWLGPPDSPQSRAFRTGHYARCRDTGTLDLFDATEAYSVFHGYSIRLTSIKAAISRCPGVADAAIVIDDGPGGQRLVAYVVPEEPAPSLLGIQHLLSTELPGCPWPTELNLVDRLPGTEEGTGSTLV